MVVNADSMATKTIECIPNSGCAFRSMSDEELEVEVESLRFQQEALTDGPVSPTDVWTVEKLRGRCALIGMCMGDIVDNLEEQTNNKIFDGSATVVPFLSRREEDE